MDDDGADDEEDDDDDGGQHGAEEDHVRRRRRLEGVSLHTAAARADRRAWLRTHVIEQRRAVLRPPQP